MMTIQRARGLGHRAFYLHPEPTMGSGGVPNGTSDEQGQARIAAIPEETKSTTTETDTKPEGEAGSTTTK